MDENLTQGDVDDGIGQFEGLDSTIDYKHLANLVHNHPALFDKRDEHFLRKDIKAKVWTEISLSMKSDAETTKVEWRKLRDTYTRYKRKLRRMAKGKTNPVTALKIQQKFHQLSFLSWLDEFIAHRNTKTSLQHMGYQQNPDSRSYQHASEDESDNSMELSPMLMPRQLQKSRQQPIRFVQPSLHPTTTIGCPLTGRNPSPSLSYQSSSFSSAETLSYQSFLQNSPTLQTRTNHTPQAQASNQRIATSTAHHYTTNQSNNLDPLPGISEQKTHESDEYSAFGELVAHKMRSLSKRVRPEQMDDIESEIMAVLCKRRDNRRDIDVHSFSTSSTSSDNPSFSKQPQAAQSTSIVETSNTVPLAGTYQLKQEKDEV